jgi:recombination protein RecA
MAPPFRTAEFDFRFNDGLDWAMELVDCGLSEGVLKQSGSWLSFTDSGEKLAQGKASAAARIRSDPALALEIRNGLKVTLREE